PDPALGQFRYYQAANVSNYNAWQTSLTRRLRNGLQFGVNYTWSRSFAYDSYGDLDLNGVTTQDNNNFRAGYGPTNYDIPSYLSANVVYRLPLDPLSHLGGRAGKEILGGWQVSTIITASSGSPVNILDGNSSYPADRPDRANNVSFYLPGYSNTLRYINPSAFALVPLVSASGAQIRPGDLSRNLLRGPGMWNIDLGLAKSFSLWERVRLQIRADAFNSFNHTNLSGLRTNISSSSFGLLTSATARAIQLGARLTF
ncbi:MAG: hypothetical protein ACREHG_09230, partial [Candidatus Saccharimonadales bacterium]